MPRKTRTHLVGDGGWDSPLSPKHIQKEEFARRVYRLMMLKSWTQSELARRAGLPRDAVSTYVNGKALPTPVNLKKLAKALDVREEELLPNYTEDAIDRDTPSIEFRVSTADPRVAWLRVNRLVTVGAGAKILELLNDDAPVDRN